MPYSVEHSRPRKRHKATWQKYISLRKKQHVQLIATIPRDITWPRYAAGDFSAELGSGRVDRPYLADSDDAAKVNGRCRIYDSASRHPITCILAFEQLHQPRKLCDHSGQIPTSRCVAVNKRASLSFCVRVTYAQLVDKLTDSMSDNHSEPLLGQEPSQEEVPEDLERGLSGEPGHDFRHLIEVQPEAVIRYLSAAGLSAQTMMFVLATLDLPEFKHVFVCRYLEKHGVSQLGSFHVPV